MDIRIPGRAGIKLSFYLPRIGLASLLLCLLSGIILSFHYHPFGNVFKNVEEITTVIPYGFFFRRLHYVSGQLFVIIMLLHTIDHFFKRRYEKYSAGIWMQLVTALCLCFFILFTGFILKGDKDGFFAGSILLNILKEIPLIGDTVTGFVIVAGEAFYWLPYLHHCFFLPLVVAFLLKSHIRYWFPDQKFIFTTAIGLSACALFIRMPLDIPPQADIRSVKGPWFFLGIQELLKIAPPFFTGIVIPFCFLLLLLLLPIIKGACGLAIRYAAIAFSFLYAMLTAAAFFFKI